MRITSVSYSRLVGLGNYENERVGITAEVAPDENADDVLASLRRWVNARVTDHESNRELEGRQTELQYAIQDYELRTEHAKKRWEMAEAFLKSHGINPDRWTDLPF